jgi:hypothetical protein
VMTVSQVCICPNSSGVQEIRVTSAYQLHPNNREMSPHRASEEWSLGSTYTIQSQSHIKPEDLERT